MRTNIKIKGNFVKNIIRSRKIFKLSFSLLIIFFLYFGTLLYFGGKDIITYKNRPVNPERSKGIEETDNFYIDIDKKVNAYRNYILEENLIINDKDYEKYEIPGLTRISISVDELYDFDEKTNSFIASGTVEAVWGDKSIQNYDILNSNDKLHLLSKNDILSTTNLNFYNAEDQLYENISLIKNEDNSGISYSKYRFKGRFSSNRNLRRFPFDKNEIRIELTHQLPAADIQITNLYKSGFHDGFWRLNSHNFIANKDCYANVYNEDGDLIEEWEGIDLYGCTDRTIRKRSGTNLFNYWDKYNFPNEKVELANSLNYSPSTSLYIDVQRSVGSSFFRYFVPLIFGVIILAINNNISIKYSEIKIGTPPTILLTFIFMQSGVHSEIPQISYIMYLDYIYFLCYLLAVLAMSCSIISVSKRNKFYKYIYWISHQSLLDIIKSLFFFVSILGPYLIWILI